MASDGALGILREGAAYALGRALTGSEAESFTKYLNLLQKWDRVFGLIGSRDPAWVVRNLFLDSLLFLRALPRSTVHVLDLGSGAGVPGIPMKIVRPELEVTMIEARRRRASFLGATIRELGLRGIRTINARAEVVASEIAGGFDVVVARCAGDPVRVLSLGLDFVRPGGSVLISGPPRPYQVPVGEWVTVPGVERGETRRFLFAEKSRPPESASQP